MVDLRFTSRELAYLLGCVGSMVRQPQLPPEHRLPLTALRDRLASLVPLDDELRAMLGVAGADPVR